MGITGEVKREYVIDQTGRADTGSVRVIPATEPAVAMSSIEAVLDAGFKPARWAGPAGGAGETRFDVGMANPVVIELSSGGKVDVAGPPYFRGTITLPLEVVACSKT